MFRRKPFEFQFQTCVEKLDFEDAAFHAAFLPKTLAKKLPFDQYPRLRIDALIEDVPHDGALQPSRRGYYLLLSKRLLKEIGKSFGDPVQISFDIADQDFVDIPPELEFPLTQQPHLLKRWNELTTGKKRSLAIRIARAKRPETREARVEEVLNLLSDGSV